MRHLAALTLTLPFLIGGSAAAEIVSTRFESGGDELRALIHRALIRGNGFVLNE